MPIRDTLLNYSSHSSCPRYTGFCAVLLQTVHTQCMQNAMKCSFSFLPFFSSVLCSCLSTFETLHEAMKYFHVIFVNVNKYWSFFRFLCFYCGKGHLYWKITDWVIQHTFLFPADGFLCFIHVYCMYSCVCNDVSLQKKPIHHRKADTYALNTEIKLNICRSTTFCAVVLCKLEHTCASLQLL